MNRAVALTAGAAALVVACHHDRGGATTIGANEPAHGAAHGKVETATDRILPLLPDGYQIVIELDLARLRKNAVIGAVVGRVLAKISAQDPAAASGPAISVSVPVSPLAQTDAVVLAAYGVGTDQAATIAIFSTTGAVPTARALGNGLVAIGPAAWLDTVEQRAKLAEDHPIAPAAELMTLRDHAVPDGATGAAIRISAKLSFDARIALARQTGVELAPAQLSLWGDVADDLAIVIDADAGDSKPSRLAGVVRGALGSLADEPTIRALGVPTSFRDARQIARGSWVRTIVAVGPTHLKRAVARAGELLGPVTAGGPS